MKYIDLNKSVYDLVNEYPELLDIMCELGFTEIKKPAMLKSVGRIMTIPKGAKVKGIDMIDIILALKNNGFSFDGPSADKGAEENFGQQLGMHVDEAGKDDEATRRKELIKSYLLRLEDESQLEAVRADFVKNFESVDAAEIMAAEEELIKEGMPVNKIKKLCDIHSSLFHGMSAEEIHGAGANGISLEDKRANKKEFAAFYKTIVGHPISTFSKENECAAKIIEDFLADPRPEVLADLSDLSIHYAKKGDLIYPLLNVKYGMFGPSNVMWTVDDEIRNGLRELRKSYDEAKAIEVVNRAKEMIYKEENILFPLCAANFTDEDWNGIYFDSKDYDMAFGIDDTWEGTVKSEQGDIDFEAEVKMPGGVLKVKELIALLNTLPLEITFVDANDINKFFNEVPKVFKRPAMALGRDVFSCHPPKIEPMVRAIIDDFKSGARDKVEVYMNKKEGDFLVTYLALRDREGTYLGTMELVQNMDGIKKHLGL
ncbi:MAG: DUF438 domain-containing protein [Ezakiella massiliensis]